MKEIIANCLWSQTIVVFVIVSIGLFLGTSYVLWKCPHLKKEKPEEKPIDPGYTFTEITPHIQNLLDDLLEKAKDRKFYNNSEHWILKEGDRYTIMVYFCGYFTSIAMMDSESSYIDATRFSIHLKPEQTTELEEALKISHKQRIKENIDDSIKEYLNV